MLWISDPNASPQDRSVLNALSGYFLDAISGNKTYGQISRNLRIVESAAGTIDITAGATVTGVQVTIVNKVVAGITLNVTTGSTAVTMGVGSLTLEWDGTQWVKIAGMAFCVLLTTGTAATFITPWSGVYKATVQGPGGTGGLASGFPNCGSGGGGGGCAISWLPEAAGVTFTYTIGATVATNTTFTDGAATLTGTRGNTGGTGSPIRPGSAGGTATGGSINIKGGAGGWAMVYTAGATSQGGVGGNSFLGAGGAGPSSAGAGSNGGDAGGYGGGGGGAVCYSSGSGTGGAGALGCIILEF